MSSDISILDLVSENLHQTMEDVENALRDGIENNEVKKVLVYLFDILSHVIRSVDYLRDNYRKSQ